MQDRITLAISTVSLLVSGGSFVVAIIAYYNSLVRSGNASVHVFLQPDFISINGSAYKGVPLGIITSLQFLVKNTGANPTIIKDMRWDVFTSRTVTWRGRVSSGRSVQDIDLVCTLKPYEQRFGSLLLELTPVEKPLL